MILPSTLKYDVLRLSFMLNLFKFKISNTNRNFGFVISYNGKAQKGKIKFVDSEN